ncbi:MAG: oligosaccharide flippase family protein [Pseudomonadota bacterium]
MLLRNAVVRGTSVLVTSAVGLLTTPLLVRLLGADDFGLWLLIMSLEFYFGALDLGLTTALTKHLATRLGSGDRAGAARLAATALCIYLALTVLVGLAYFSMSGWLPGVFNLTPDQAGRARLVIMLLSLPVAASFLARVVEAVLLACERHHYLGLVEIVGNLLRLGMIAGLFALKGDLLLLAVGYGAVNLCVYLLTGLGAWRAGRGWLRPRPHWQPDEARRLWAYVRQFAPAIVGEVMRNYSTTILLGGLIGPLAVATYGVGSRIMMLSLVMLATALGVAMARFAVISTRPAAESRELLLRVSLHAGLAGGYVALGILLLARPFIMLWVGPAFSESVEVAQVLALPLFAYIATFPGVLLLQGLGRLRVNSLVCLGEAGLAIGLVFILAQSHGPLGAAAALAAAMLSLRPWLIPWRAARLVQLSLGRLAIKALVRPGLAMALAAGAFLLTPLAGLTPSWPHFILQGLVYSLFFLAATWLIGLDHDARTLWREKLGAWLARLRSASD